MPRRNALMAGAALECIHCYSLVHDDLPAMDNDELRRGQPTAHRKFDEATAILAGDGLLTFAFDVLSREDTHRDATVRVELISALARAAELAANRLKHSIPEIVLRRRFTTHSRKAFSMPERMR